MAVDRKVQRGQAYELHKQGMTPKEISQSLGVPDGTVRRWKYEDNWDNLTPEEREERRSKEPKARARKNAKTSDSRPLNIVDYDGTLETMSNEKLTDAQKIFCILYSRTYNASQSYQKAFGCDINSASVSGHWLLRNPNVKEEIDRLLEIKRKSIPFQVEDLLELHMRIAFADMGNYLDFGSREEIKYKDENDTVGNKVVYNYVRLNNSETLDTQLIQEVKEGRDGISIKLYDKQKSMDWLEKYFLLNPLDKHKIDFDNARLDIERKKNKIDEDRLEQEKVVIELRRKGKDE